MLIDITRYASALDIQPTGILHVGAHQGEERDLYRSMGWEALAWVEAQAALASSLQATVGDSERVYHGAAWSEAGRTLGLRLTSNSQSSSLRDLVEHAVVYPDITTIGVEQVTTVALADIWRAFRSETGVACDLLVLDIQGAELDAMRGLDDVIHEFTWIYTEVSTRELYARQALLPEVDDFLRSQGFRRVLTSLVPNCGWGDAIYVRDNEVARLGAARIWRARTNVWSRNVFHRGRASAVKLGNRLLHRDRIEPGT